MRFVHGVGTVGFGESKAEQLGASVGGGVEAGDVGSALRGGIRIIQVVLIDKVVGGEISQACIRIEARSGFVVAESFVLRLSLKKDWSRRWLAECIGAAPWREPTRWIGESHRWERPGSRARQP